MLERGHGRTVPPPGAGARTASVPRGAHAGTEALRPPLGVGHVVAMSEQDVIDATGSGHGAGERLGVSGRVDEQVARRPAHEPRGGPEGILRAVAAVEDARARLDLPRV